MTNAMERRCALRALRLRLIAAVAVVTCLAASAAIGTPAVNGCYEVPAVQWLKAYVDYFTEHRLDIGATFTAPAIWLFSPDGALTDVITVDKDPDLNDLTATFPSTGLTQRAGMPSLAQTRELLSKALQQDVLRPPPAGVWTAVLFLSDSPECGHCAAFDARLKTLEQQKPGRLRVVRVKALF